MPIRVTHALVDWGWPSRTEPERQVIQVCQPRLDEPDHTLDSFSALLQAIYHANKGRDAVYRQNADLTVDRTALETDNLQKALELWAEARVVSGQALWIPSGEFVAELKASGVINSASISQEIIKDMWDATVGVVQGAIDWAQYASGFAIGLLEGAYGALKDLFTGVVDLIKMIWTVVKGIFSGFSEMKELAKKLLAAWKNRKDITADVATDFMKKWENPADYDRGNFQGEFLGYVMMLAFITLVTLGEGAVIAGAGRFGSFIKVIQVADAAGDISTYARGLKRALKLPASAVDQAEDVLAPRARKLADVEPEAPAPAKAPDAPAGKGGAPAARGLRKLVGEEAIDLGGEVHHLRIWDKGDGTFELTLCSDCAEVRGKIAEVLADAPAKGPNKALRQRLEKLDAKVAALEKGLADGTVKHTQAVKDLNQIAAHLRDAYHKFPGHEPLCVFCTFKARLDFDQLAASLGFTRIAGRSHGQPIFRKGNEYISPDIDGHKGGVWKKATGSSRNLRPTMRDGTYNEDLTVRVDD